MKNISATTTAIKILFFALSLHLWGVEIEITNPRTTFLKGSQKEYSISAKKYIEKIKAKDILKMLLFRDKYFLANIYYEDGNFTKDGLFLHFKKAYKFDAKVNMFKIKGNYNDTKFKADKAVYLNNSLFLYNCEINYPKKILRRKIYQIIIDK